MRVHLFVDFDSTLTEHDTISALAEVAYARPRLPSTPPWETFVSAYLADLSAFKATAPYAARTTLSAELAFQQSQRVVETQSLDRLFAAGVFNGLTRKAVETGACGMIAQQRVRPRDGWDACLALVVRRLGRVTVLSVNWSRAWVRACLRQFAASSTCRSGIELDHLEIFSNELEGLDCAEGSSGRIVGGLVSGRDKASKMLDILRHTTFDNANNGGRDKPCSVYVGDSTADLEAIVSADVGVWLDARDERIRGTGELGEILGRVGWSVKTANEFTGLESSKPCETVWVAGGFAEVEQMLERI